MLLIGLAAPLRSQEGRGLIRGTVAAESGEPLPFALVVLDPGFTQRFADERGAFVYAGLRPGTYRLRVRQVGYRPADTALAVGRDSAQAVSVVLVRVPIRLAVIAVSSEGVCLTPGPPEPGDDSVLAVLFDQLRENAARYQLLVDAYPHLSRLVRRFYLESEDGGSHLVRIDTLDVRSNERARYRPGRVVRNVNGERAIVLPTLPDLADTVFQRAHCFRARNDSIGDHPMVRLDFTAAESVRASDVDGSAWLDPATFQLRQLTIRLTRAERADIANVAAVSATEIFREILPSVIAPDRVTAVTSYVRNQANGRFVGHLEEQRVVELRWLREVPGAARGPERPRNPSGVLPSAAESPSSSMPPRQTVTFCR